MPVQYIIILNIVVVLYISINKKYFDHITITMFLDFETFLTYFSPTWTSESIYQILKINAEFLSFMKLRTILMCIEYG